MGPWCSTKGCDFEAVYLIEVNGTNHKFCAQCARAYTRGWRHRQHADLGRIRRIYLDPHDSAGQEALDCIASYRSIPKRRPIQP